VVVLNKKGFKLPRVERDTFILLLRSGLDYNRELGEFSINNYNNIERLVDVLAGILKAEKIDFHCVCPRCLKGDKAQKRPKITGQGTLDLFG
jgi:hypothetical protein